MKKIIMVLASILTLTSFASQDLDYDAIWKKGYINGYCYEIEYCVEPIPPVPPVPRLQDTTYENIYNRGFVTGLKANQ